VKTGIPAHDRHHGAQIALGTPMVARTHVAQDRGVRPHAATLYLALFLMLLAFFLFLTSISSFDPARAAAVMTSVDAHFADAGAQTLGAETIVPHFAGAGSETIAADQAFIDQVAGALAPLPAAAADAGLPAGAPWHGVRLAPDDLFVGRSAALTAAGRQALEAASAAMHRDAASSAGAARRVDIAVGGSDALAVRRAAVLAAVFTTVNGPRPVSMRTLPGTAAIDLVFYAVQPAGRGA